MPFEQNRQTNYDSQMKRATIFISDLHLSETAPGTAELLFEFADKIVSQQELQIDALYILGDLFQYWGGDDDGSPFNEQIKTAIKKISSTIPVYIMPGNRDFLVGEKFANDCGAVLISDPRPIDLYGKITLLTHGDILCADDWKYRIFRTIIRIPYGIKAFLKLPLTVRLSVAHCIQQYSSKTKGLKNKLCLMPQLAAIQKLLIAYGAEQIIHGHIHIAESADIPLPYQHQQNAKRISLGEWTDKKSVLICYPNGFDFQD